MENNKKLTNFIKTIIKETLNENVGNIQIPQYIKDDISKTGYDIIDIHTHGKFYILKMKQTVDMNWDVKDFDRFYWVVGNGGMNRVNDTRNEFKLKVKF